MTWTNCCILSILFFFYRAVFYIDSIASIVFCKSYCSINHMHVIALHDVALYCTELCCIHYTILSYITLINMN